MKSFKNKYWCPMVVLSITIKLWCLHLTNCQAKWKNMEIEKNGQSWSSNHSGVRVGGEISKTLQPIINWSTKSFLLIYIYHKTICFMFVFLAKCWWFCFFNYFYELELFISILWNCCCHKSGSHVFFFFYIFVCHIDSITLEWRSVLEIPVLPH